MAFYKDKMIKMLDIISELTFDRIEKWKISYIGTNTDMMLVKEVADLIMHCITATVFG